MSTATPYQIACQRLRQLAANPKTPRDMAGDLSLVLLMAAECERARAAIDAARPVLIACDSELSAIAHGRPPSPKDELLKLSYECRKLYEPHGGSHAQ